ncbi:MAG: substrate-binding domain-containing protein [Betaproteobacteria bacterium]|nr:substrate-binding domain-containing protein [Betaproteobacteria bacterium]
MNAWLFQALLALVVLCATPAIGREARDIRMATTTSTDNSGLLKVLLPKYEARCGCNVRVMSVGTGKALDLGKNGDVDVVLVHARPAEDKFVAEGHGVNRRDVMYNDFILVGPKSDPAGMRGQKSVIDAFKALAQGKSRFISRGDNSGTDQMEKSYWKEAGVKPGGGWFVSAGLGMGEVLTMAGEMQGYTLSDRATYGAYRAKTGLDIVLAGDPKMFNPYGIIAVNPNKYPAINYDGAMDLIEWITSLEGRKLIAAFKVDGEQLFFPAREE